MADGGGGNLAGINLNAAQQRDRGPGAVEDILGGDTRPSDQERESVLSLGAKTQSYTSGQAEEVEAPIAGGGLMASPALEFQRMRQQEERMRRAQEQFTGVPTEGPAGAPQPQAPRAAPEQAAPGAPAEEEEEEGELSEEDLAQQLQAQQEQTLRSQAVQQAANRAKQELERQAKVMAKRAASQGTRYTLEGAEVATSETGVALLVLFVQMNIQLIMKYIFRPLISGASEELDKALEGAPFFDQSLPEDFAIVAIDIAMCCNALCCNPVCAPIILTVAFVAAIFFLLKSKIGL